MAVRIALIFGLFLISSFSSAQTMEYSVQLHSSLSSYWGGSSGNLSYVSLYLGRHSIENPYGRLPAFSYGVSTQAQMIIKRFVFGLQAGYEILKSKTRIYGPPGEEAIHWINTNKSSLILSNHFFYLNPYVGKRIEKGKWLFDIVGGVDVAFGHKSKIHLNITDTNNYDWDQDIDKNATGFDFRPRISVVGHKGKYGYFLGYSLGIIPYENEIGYASASKGIYSRIIRLGVSYKIN